MSFLVYFTAPFSVTVPCHKPTLFVEQLTFETRNSSFSILAIAISAGMPYGSVDELAVNTIRTLAVGWHHLSFCITSIFTSIGTALPDTLDPDSINISVRC
jgi:hypothetical protein